MSVSEDIASQLLDRIANGDLVPGERLPGERQLAEQLDVSRVSVRAALQGLKAQGFLEAVQGGGTRVISSAGDMDSPLTKLLRTNRKNLHDLAEIRRGLEVWAARRAAQNATLADIAELDRVMNALQQVKGRARAEEEANFHHAVARAAGSPVYLHIFDVIRDTLRSTLDYHRYRLFEDKIDNRLLLEQHQAVVDGIRGRNAEAAGAAMERHLNWVQERYKAERNRQSNGVGSSL